MASATYTTAEGVNEFATTDASGALVVIAAGKNYSTADPKLIAELDAQSHAVKRVRARGEGS
ncbi:MAG: hypothetical protein RMM28_10295 [Thermoleophilia bacterium]|nr:hypothetical protein [Gaiellaceae bacterium]MDW8339515.1 hypothetical protein [Thermoleophilia bacterium]